MQSALLLKELIAQTKKAILTAQAFQTADLNTLVQRPAPGAWNALECLEHLNLYGDFYLPEIDKRIKKAAQQTEPVFKPGLLGDYFAKSMLPKGKLKKMKTFKDKNPISTNLDTAVIERFILQQQELIRLMELAQKVSLNRVKIKTSISSLIQLKLGDVFRFIINHNIRHLQQAEQALAGAKAA
ncbi:DinB family protein [Flavobacterium sp. RHBU_3]|uniref:DinB family protein n=1 Tax=Flavobacterium sp. RHBU_3 TaxID=3391184 RepID=UPI003984B989